jgi:uncharacterized protein
MASVQKLSNAESIIPGEPFCPTSWKLMFVQDCNLRCGYCSTGFGRFGDQSRFMQPDVCSQLVEMISFTSATRTRVDVEFGGGELFLRFKEAMLFLDALQRRLAEQQILVFADILTNGTVATEDQLRECLKRRITLTFSVDGPAEAHDAFRHRADGKPTHRVAFEKWRRYRDMTVTVADPPGCEISTVISGDSRLLDVARFWREQGVKRYKAVPAELSKFLRPLELEAWQIRCQEYLVDLKVLAFAEAERLHGRPLEEFEGPSGILRSWQRLARGDSYRPCGAAYDIVAVGARGDLFPCQGFVGFAERSIGDVWSGVVPERLLKFRAARVRAQGECQGCWARFICDGGCFASDPAAGVVLNCWNSCEFARAHAEIAVQSFHHWRNGTQQAIERKK